LVRDRARHRLHAPGLRRGGPDARRRDRDRGRHGRRGSLSRSDRCAPGSTRSLRAGADARRCQQQQDEREREQPSGGHEAHTKHQSPRNGKRRPILFTGTRPHPTESRYGDGIVSGRRLLVLFLVLGAIGVPAGVLRAACAGRSCHSDSHGTVRIPFCPLPDNLKTEIAAGYREGRSPDVLAVTTSAALWGGTDNGSGISAAWPSVSGGPSTLVPIVFWGTGVSKAARLPSVVGLDQIAPTLSTVIGFRRSHPDVRAGRPLSGVANGARPRLVVEIAWTGIGSGQLRHAPGAWPYLRTMMRTGVGTLD